MNNIVSLQMAQKQNKELLHGKNFTESVAQRADQERSEKYSNGFLHSFTPG